MTFLFLLPTFTSLFKHLSPKFLCPRHSINQFWDHWSGRGVGGEVVFKLTISKILHFLSYIVFNISLLMLSSILGLDFPENPVHCTVYNIFYCRRHSTVHFILLFTTFLNSPRHSYVLAILEISFGIIGRERLGNRPVHTRHHFVLERVLWLVCRSCSRKRQDFFVYR